MFKSKFFIAVVMGVCIFTTTSCSGPKKIQQRIIPQAVNTINSVNLSELNLTHGTDYTIMNTITLPKPLYYITNNGKEKSLLSKKKMTSSALYIHLIAKLKHGHEPILTE